MTGAHLSRRLLRRLGGRPKQFLEMHFARLEAQLARVEAQHVDLETQVGDLKTQVGRSADRLGALERSLAALPALLDRMTLIEESSAAALQSAARVENVARELNTALRDSGLADRRSAPPSQVDLLTDAERRLCDHALSHDGYASQAGLWFNPPLSIHHARTGVRLEDVNERIAEVPFVLRELAATRAGARVLDVGSRESTLPLTLAALGYDVTALDPRGYPLSHPGLSVAAEGVADHRPSAPYDAITCVSTIEHLGIGSYALDAADDADLHAMSAMRDMLTPGGLLLLTTPYGPASIDALERTYDAAGLARLLNGWEVQHLSYLRQQDRLTWTWTDDATDLERERGVALVRASPAAS